MGWSCNKAANETLDLWTAACVAQTGVQNTYTTDTDKFFFEVSRVEHADGAITGRVFKYLRGINSALPVGSFRINGDGSIARKPSSFPFKKVFVNYPNVVREIYGMTEVLVPGYALADGRFITKYDKDGTL